MAPVRIGTCSWKFPSWEGLIYSAADGINYLSEYAQKYDTVEVDQWFWSLFGEDNIGLPKPSDVVAYRDSVSDDFRFTIKRVLPLNARSSGCPPGMMPEDGVEAKRRYQAFRMAEISSQSSAISLAAALLRCRSLTPNPLPSASA